jgi:hypothetical protein
MLRQFGDELQGVEKVDILLEAFRVGCVEQDSTLERFVTDFLQRNWRASYVLGEIFLSLTVQDADAVVDARP